jgi:putative flippase GtrA
MSKARALADRYGILRVAQFGIAGIIGFLAAEGILVAGLFLLNGNIETPSSFASSPTLLTIDVIAFLAGVTVGFFVNERTTVRKSLGQGNKNGTLVRLAKYQGVYVLGNAITIGTQLALLAAFALSPAVGVLVGAVVAYPVSYVISMRFVWKV